MIVAKAYVVVVIVVGLWCGVGVQHLDAIEQPVVGPADKGGEVCCT
jgi:hypothetical protein